MRLSPRSRWACTIAAGVRASHWAKLISCTTSARKSFRVSGEFEINKHVHVLVFQISRNLSVVFPVFST